MNPPDQPEFWVLDGLEDTPTGRVARLERPDGTGTDLSADLLPPGTQAGDVLEVISGPDGSMFKLDRAASAKRRLEAQRQLDALNQARPAEEINL